MIMPMIRQQNYTSNDRFKGCNPLKSFSLQHNTQICLFYPMSETYALLILRHHSY